MARTLAPVGTTLAQARRLPTWAVAGMRMPPEERRSPSLDSVFTRMRSFSILMGRPLSDWSARPGRDREGRAGSVPAGPGPEGEAPAAGLLTGRTVAQAAATPVTPPRAGS